MALFTQIYAGAAQQVIYKNKVNFNVAKFSSITWVQKVKKRKGNFHSFDINIFHAVVKKFSNYFV